MKRKYRKKPKLEKEKKVSVIIPCKGEIELENFENQNYKNYEVI
ncbi:MAG: glycosyltransferase family 2 protein, partial [Thermoplasmata archaeon]